MLADQNVPRDVRTIQRWCKARKIKAIIDDHDIERYLMKPSSVRDMIATLQAERSRHVAPHFHPSRRVVPDAGASPEPAAASTREALTDNGDRRHADAATAEPAATTADARREDVASLRRRVEELEEKNRSLEVDKRVRDQLLERQERHYQQMIGEAFARSERVGELEAENRQLRQLLPPDTGERPPKAQPPFSFTPRSVVEQGDNPGEGSVPRGGVRGRARSLLA